MLARHPQTHRSVCGSVVSILAVVGVVVSLVIVVRVGERTAEGSAAGRGAKCVVRRRGPWSEAAAHRVVVVLVMLGIGQP